MLQLHKQRLSQNEPMKPQKWRLSWCKLLFITASGFLWRLEPSHRTVLGWVFVKCSYFLKLCCNYIFQIFLLSISKKERWRWLSHWNFLLLQIPGWDLFLERSYLPSITSPLVVIHSSQKCNPLWRTGRGVFRTQSRIYGGALLRKELTA